MPKKFSPEEHLKRLREAKGPLSENKSERDAWNRLLKQRKKEEAEQGYSESALFKYRDNKRSIAIVPMEIKMWKPEEEAQQDSEQATPSDSD